MRFKTHLSTQKSWHVITEESIRALRLMARLTRQYCVRRKGDLVDQATALAQSQVAPPDLRSAAAHIAVMTAQIGRNLTDARAAFGGRSLAQVQVEVARAVRRSLELGLLPETETFVREYLGALR
jgi:hypothetical protein